MFPEKVTPTRKIPLTTVFHEPPSADTTGFRTNDDMHSYYDDNPTPFGAILRGAMPARILAETDRLLAFVDRAPKSLTLHALIIPKRYIPTILNVTSSEEDLELLYEMRDLGQRLAERYHCAADHRMVFHVPPHNSVDHLHLHVLCNADLTRKGHYKYSYDTIRCVSMDTFLQQLQVDT